MAVVNRCAVAVSPRQPMLDWARPFRSPLEGEVASEGQAAAAEESLYLIATYDDEQEAIERLRDRHGAIFEAELDLWCRDRELWPRDRSLERFLEWFAVRFHHLVEDLGSEPLRSDTLETSFEHQLRQALG